MTKRCFSSDQLYALRNEISVQVLIEKTLHIPFQMTKGCFRFLCPLCSGFDTAVNPKTNLARCFRCEKNFNTIDLVMLVRQAKFVDSVRFLKSIHQKNPVCPNRDELGTISGNNPQDYGPMNRKTPPGKSHSNPCQIGESIGSILALEHADIPQKRSAEYKQIEPAQPHQNAEEDRIVKLERQMEYLGRQIQYLARAINNQCPSK
jgi:hypothetical protein